jgi:hypothetical protein
LTFSGVGGTVANFGGKERHPTSDTWCLYDGQLLVAEVIQALAGFRKGVKVLVIADCSSAHNSYDFRQAIEVKGQVRHRALPISLAETVYLKNNF